jgi:D-amino-acid dehydrogenase
MSAAPRALVIGGGAMGLCSAYFLWKSGVAVEIVEKDDVGAGSSLHNAGLVCPGHFIPLAAPGAVAQGLKYLLNPESPFYIKPRADLDLLWWMWRFKQSSTEQHVRRSMRLLMHLNAMSLALYGEIAATEGLEFGLQRRGLLSVFRTDRGRAGCVHEAQLAHEIGLEARLVDREELQHLEPGVRWKATGALYYPGDAHLVPARFVRALADFLIAKGVRIHTGVPVTGFETQGDRVTAVRTPSGALAADEYVLASGAWSPSLLRGLRIRMLQQPGKGYSVALENPPRMPAIPAVLREAKVAVTPMDGFLRFAGTLELAGLDTSITQRRVEAILKAVPQYVDDIDPARVDRRTTWSGLRPCTPDGLPYVGRFRRHPNLVAATGHAMIGITMATATGKLVSQIVQGKEPDLDIRALDPDRFT